MLLNSFNVLLMSLFSFYEPQAYISLRIMKNKCYFTLNIANFSYYWNANFSARSFLIDIFKTFILRKASESARSIKFMRLTTARTCV